jgi:hypothetical protein
VPGNYLMTKTRSGLKLSNFTAITVYHRKLSLYLAYASHS